MTKETGCTLQQFIDSGSRVARLTQRLGASAARDDGQEGLSEEEALKIVRERMKVEGVSLRKAAKEMGVSSGFLSLVMNGKSAVTDKILNWVGIEKVTIIRHKA